MIAEFLGLKFECRDETTDWNTVSACTLGDEYGLADLDLDGKLVFDLGAHIGGVSVWCASRGARVVAVEPVPDNVRLIRANAEANGVKVQVEEACINDGMVAIVRYNYSGNFNAHWHRFIGGTYHVWEDDPPEDVTFDQTYVQGISITELVSRYGRPDVIKMDCEGGEWFAFVDPAIQGVPLIVGEWHPLEGRLREGVSHLLGGAFTVTFSGPEAGPGGFTAVLG